MAGCVGAFIFIYLFIVPQVVASAGNRVTPGQVRVTLSKSFGNRALCKAVLHQRHGGKETGRQRWVRT